MNAVFYTNMKRTKTQTRRVLQMQILEVITRVLYRVFNYVIHKGSLNPSLHCKLPMMMIIKLNATITLIIP